MRILWEHYVLNELRARAQKKAVHYWRDKRGHEVDFVLLKRGGNPVAIECKWSAKNIRTGNIKAFRRRYPDGENWVVAHDVERPYRRMVDGLDLRFIGLASLAESLAGNE